MAEEFRPTRRKDQLGRKRSLAPVLLVAGVLIIGIIIASALASNVFPFELTPPFLKEAQPLVKPSPLSGEGELRLLVRQPNPKLRSNRQIRWT